MFDPTLVLLVFAATAGHTRFLDHTHPSFQLTVSATSNGETVSAVRSISVLIECEDRNC